MRLALTVFMSIIITSTQVFAQEAAATPPAPSPMASLMPLLLIVAIMYLLIIRPQNKMRKQHQEMVKSLERGDVVITAGGIRGTITRVEDKRLQVEIAPGVEVTVVTSTIMELESRKNAPKQPANDVAPAKGSKKKAK